MKKLVFWALIGALMSTPACKNEPIPVTAVSLNAKELVLAAGEIASLTVVVTPQNAANKTVIWSSGDESVATVDQSGVVTAVAPGTTTIQASSAEGNKTDRCTVTVPPPALQGISFSRTELIVIVGQMSTLIPTFTPADTEDKTVVWSSDNESVATVDQTGKVTAITPGKATIQAAGANDKTASCVVTVPFFAVTNITLNKTAATIVAGESETLIPTITPEHSLKTVVWSSSDESVATVDESGTVTAHAPGKAAIRATADGGRWAQCVVTTIVPAYRVTLSEEFLTMSAISPASLSVKTVTAVLLPENSTDRVVWSSSNESVATVDQSGKITALAEGSATITAATPGGVGDECYLTVQPITSVTFAQTAISLRTGETKTVEINYQPAYARFPDIDGYLREGSTGENVLTWEIKELFPSRAELTVTLMKSLNLYTPSINLRNYLGVEAVCQVSHELTEPVVSFSVDQSSYSVARNGSLTVRGTYSPADAKITNFKPLGMTYNSISWGPPRNGTWWVSFPQVMQDETVTMQCDGLQTSFTITVTEP